MQQEKKNVMRSCNSLGEIVLERLDIHMEKWTLTSTSHHTQKSMQDV